MRREWLIVAACAVGCGRLGFDAVTSDSNANGDGNGGGNGDADGSNEPWELVQVVGAGSGTTPKNMVSIAPTAANHLIVVAVEVPDVASPVSAVNDNAGNTYERAVGGVATDNLGVMLRLEIWYAAAAAAGATTITATSAPTATVAVVAWEFEHIATVNPFVSATSANDQPAAMQARAPAITTTADGQLVVAAVLVRFTATGISSGTGFTSDSLAHANGWGHLTDPNAPAGVYQAAWDTDQSGSYCGVSAAFRTGP